jgi:predicted CopG family antitoxin
MFIKKMKCEKNSVQSVVIKLLAEQIKNSAVMVVAILLTTASIKIKRI